MAPQGRYDFADAEPRLQRRWAELKIYEFDPTHPGPVFTVDTPPPTVSGQIHIGHVFSYTQADIAIRYHRMRGEHIFYPFGFDDNGLPTERFTEQSRGISARAVGRDAFIRACLELSAEVEATFERFWKRLGLSVDWRLRYSTIDDRSRRVAQRGFIDLYQRGQAERREAPTLWCPTCGTAVAQADLEDGQDVPVSFVTLAFPTTDGREIRIATTRPELLPACVAVFVHPNDARFTSLIGAVARVPLFDLEVPILANPEAQLEKGTGAVMCCTFGDLSDVRWWHAYHLPLRLAIGADGRMNERAAPYASLRIAQARSRLLEDLQAQGLIRDCQEIAHTISVHERCGTPIEYLVAAQWFISVLPHRRRLLEAGREVAWHPEYMHTRYESWVAGLAWDWNISRQRYYGVPFPVWYCDRCGTPLLASPDQLPVDPTTASPSGPCPQCGGTSCRPETDVMDTWATSSLTPQICATLAEDLGLPAEEFMARHFPMSLRPNAHDIIRTWDFYTIVQSLAHTGQVPWRAVMIAGHAQDPSGKKLSKSKLKAAQDPTATIEQFSADAVRYWTAGVRVGSDTQVSEDAFRQGGRLVTKLWNASRFVLMHEDRNRIPPGHSGTEGAQRADGDPAESPREGRDSGVTRQITGGMVEELAPAVADRWLLTRLGRAVARATEAFDAYEPASARGAIERFFWADFCDTYLELVKYRLDQGMQPNAAPESHAGAVAALATLRQALLSVLKLLAPFLPHITEEIYLEGFAVAEGTLSVHLCAWPDSAAFPEDAEAARAGEVLLTVVDEVRRWKAERNLSVGAAVAELTITCPGPVVSLLRSMALDLRSITRAARIEVREGSGVGVHVEPQ